MMLLRETGSTGSESISEASTQAREVDDRRDVKCGIEHEKDSLEFRIGDVSALGAGHWL